MRIRLVVIGFLVAVASGCASTTVGDTGPRLTSGAVPQLGQTATARVGDEIYRSFNYYETDRPARLVLADSIRGRIALQSFDALAGTILIRNAKGEYCSQDNLLVDPLAGPYKQVCFKDEDGDNRLEKAGATPGLIRFWTDLATPVGIEARAADSVTSDAGGFKRELIYQGVDGATLRVSYREYNDDFARPAFTQDLTYPVSNGKAQIVFKDLTIEVSSVGPAQITYSVTKGRL